MCIVWTKTKELGKWLCRSAGSSSSSSEEEEEEDARRVLCVSKKHSGSLVMAPPFYAKNSTANAFSRLPALLLRDHFRAVFAEEDEGDAVFAQWWAHAQAHALCYSFECVVPRVLGDHGATPKAARAAAA